MNNKRNKQCCARILCASVEWAAPTLSGRINDYTFVLNLRPPMQMNKKCFTRSAITGAFQSRVFFNTNLQSIIGQSRYLFDFLMNEIDMGGNLLFLYKKNLFEPSTGIYGQRDRHEGVNNKQNSLFNFHFIFMSSTTIHIHL